MDYETFKADVIRAEAIYLEAVDVLNTSVPAVYAAGQEVLTELEAGAPRESLRPKAVKYFEEKARMEDSIILSSGELAAKQTQMSPEESAHLWVMYGDRLVQDCPGIAQRLNKLVETYGQLCAKTMALPGVGRTSEIASLL